MKTLFVFPIMVHLPEESSVLVETCYCFTAFGGVRFIDRDCVSFLIRHAPNGRIMAAEGSAASGAEARKGADAPSLLEEALSKAMSENRSGRDAGGTPHPPQESRKQPSEDNIGYSIA
jgi:hypothetical protein